MKLFKGSPIWIFLLHWLPVCGGEGFLIKNVRLGVCLHASPLEMEKIGLSECKPHSPQFQWGWDPASRAIVSLKTNQCLAVQKPQEFAAAQLEPCGGRGHQSWACSKKGHLTLQGLGLHLSMKQGGQKAFLSGEKDKFSRWKTWLDEIICTADLAATRRLGDPTEQPVVPWERMPQSKTFPGNTVTSPETPTATASAPPPWEMEQNITGALPPGKEEMNLEPEEEKQTPGKPAGNQKKLAGARSPGTNWKTVMLVLSPLAFILGMIILALNIHYNKKKKRLSGLKSYPEKRLQVSFEERLPFSGAHPCTSRKTQTPQSSPSPSLKHGEILIEWKDGTVTPLFDTMSYPIC